MPSFKEYRLPKYTGLSNLTLSTVKEIPQPGPGQVLVKVHAVSLNYRDLLVAKGQYGLGVKENVVPCSDGAGEVIATGDQVTEFKVGDRVAGTFNQDHVAGDIANKYHSVLGGTADGTLAEYILLAEHGLVHIPAHLSYEEASTLPCAAVTAWNALYGGSKPLLPGQTVLLQGSGGVSIFGLQIAVAGGARTIVTSSSDAKLEHAKKLGATYTINYKTTPNWEEEVLKLTNGQGVDHILEVGGPGTLGRSLTSIAPGGAITCIGFVAGGEESKNIPTLLLMKQATMRGIVVGSRVLFQELNNSLEANNIKPIVDKVFPFEKALEAFEYLESQKHFGKVVIKVSQ